MKQYIHIEGLASSNSACFMLNGVIRPYCLQVFKSAEALNNGSACLVLFLSTTGVVSNMQENFRAEDAV